MRMSSLSKLLRRRGSAGRQARRAAPRRPSLELLEQRLAPSTTPTTDHFAVIGDYGSAGPNELAVANLVKSWNPDFIVTTGDNNYNTPPSTTFYDTNVGQYFHNFMGSYTGAYGAGASTNAFFPSLGEHDWGDGGAAYSSYFTALPSNPRYYKVSKGPVDLFAISSDASEPDGNVSTSPQAAWLKAQLAASTAPWKLVYFSEAPYSSGTSHGNTTWMQWPFQQWGASAVLSGHEHNYERLNVNGLPYFVNGLGGKSIYPFGTPLSYSQVRYNADYGAMLVDASSTQITFQFISEAGTVIDTYTMNYALPAAPSSLATSGVSPTQINLTWANNANNQTGFNIERSTDGTNFTPIATVGPQTTQYLDSGLSNTQTYFYRVNALNAGGVSSYSNSASATPVATLAFNNAPSDLVAAVDSGNQVNLTWTDNSNGLNDFNIERSTDGTNYAQIATVSAGTTSFADSGLALQPYFYRVRGSNHGIPTVSSSVVGATLLPAAPSNLTPTVANAQEVDLTWTGNSSNATGFTIERSTDGVNFTQVAATSTTSYADIGLTPTATYYYRVSAYNAGGNTYSSSVTATTPALTVPAAPTNLVATVNGASKLTLNWTSNSGGAETGFKIYVSTDGVTFHYNDLVSQGVTQYVATELDQSTTYYFRVLAFNQTVTSDFSNTISATTFTLPAPAPSNATVAVNSATKVTLSWVDNSSNETGFYVFLSTDGVNFTNWAATTQNVTSLTIGGLNPTTNYWFYVKAYNAGGLSPGSNTVSVTTPPLPIAPSGLTAAASSATKVSLAWTDNSTDETGFYVYQSTDGVNFSNYAAAGANVTSWTVTNLNPSTTYWFQVRSYNNNGNSVPSNTASVTTPALPVAPSSLTATPSTASKINLSWTDNSTDETGFYVYKSTDGVTFTNYATVGANVTGYTMTGLSPSTTYWFQVRSYNTNGTSSASNTASAATFALPNAPSNLTATATSASKISLTWADNSSDETGFSVYQSTDGVNFTNYATAGANVTSWTVTNLNQGTTYWFQVKSYNSNGTSPASNTASATTMALPVAPSGLSASAINATKISLSWTNNDSTATGTKIYKSTDGGNSYTWTDTAGAGVSSYTMTGLTSGTTYYFKLASYNTAGTSAYSNVANATTMTLCAAPSNLTVTAVSSKGKSTLNWTDNSSNPQETGFYIYRSTDKVTWTNWASVGQNVTTYTDGGLSTSTVYYYQVKAYSAAGNSLSSNWAGTDGTSGAAGTSGSMLETANGYELLPTGVGEAIGWTLGRLGIVGELTVFVDDPDGTLTNDEHARIDDAIATINAAKSGLTLVEVTDPSQADIVVYNSTTTALGGMANGVLGLTQLTFNGSDSGDVDNAIGGQAMITLVEGWNWYTGSDASAIGSDQYDYLSVATHELGHAVGLYHDTTSHGTLNGDGHSVMYPSLGTAQIHRQLSSYDISYMSFVYSTGANPGVTSVPDGTNDALYVDGRVPPDETPVPVPSVSVVPPELRAPRAERAATVSSIAPAVPLPVQSIFSSAGSGAPMPGTTPATSVMPGGPSPVVPAAQAAASLGVGTRLRFDSPGSADAADPLQPFEDERIEEVPAPAGLIPSSPALTPEHGGDSSPDVARESAVPGVPPSGTEDGLWAGWSVPDSWQEASAAYFKVMDQNADSMSWLVAGEIGSAENSAAVAGFLFAAASYTQTGPDQDLERKRRFA